MELIEKSQYRQVQLNEYRVMSTWSYRILVLLIF